MGRKQKQREAKKKEKEAKKKEREAKIEQREAALLATKEEAQEKLEELDEVQARLLEENVALEKKLEANKIDMEAGRKRLEAAIPPEELAELDERYEIKRLNKEKIRKCSARILASRSDDETSPCLHGSTKEAFENEEYVEIMGSLIASQDPSVNHPALVSKDFCKFLFAWCAGHFLLLREESRQNNFLIPHSPEWFLLQVALQMRYNYIPHFESGEDLRPGNASYEKAARYINNCFTDRGRINCLARETPCKCMKASKQDAKLMANVFRCQGCHGMFPKDVMMTCKRCKVAHYCGKDCQYRDWMDHKKGCKLLSRGEMWTPSFPTIAASGEGNEITTGGKKPPPGEGDGTQKKPAHSASRGGGTVADSKNPPASV